MFNEKDVIKGVIFKSDKLLNAPQFNEFTEEDKDKYKLVHLKDNIYMGYVIVENKQFNHTDIINYYDIKGYEIDSFNIGILRWLIPPEIDCFDLNDLEHFSEFKNELIYASQKYYDIKRCNFNDSYRIQMDIINSWKNNYKKLK